MDEPVQNLADIYFLAFMALVKRMAIFRQVVLSTADGNVAELIKRQMVSGSLVEGAPRCVQWEWLSFDPENGPEVRFFDAREAAALRLRTEGGEPSAAPRLQ